MSKEMREFIDKVKSFEQFVNENSSFEHSEVYIQLIELIKNSETYNEFETKVIYYGYPKLIDVNIYSLINTEKVSGLPIQTNSPIRVGMDIKTNKMYIIDGHNRVKKAKFDENETIKAFVTRGIITTRGQFNLEPETALFVEENNINLKELYKKWKK
jgi:hypothetical protein